MHLPAFIANLFSKQPAKRYKKRSTHLKSLLRQALCTEFAWDFLNCTTLGKDWESLPILSWACITKLGECSFTVFIFMSNRIQRFLGPAYCSVIITSFDWCTFQASAKTVLLLLTLWFLEHVLPGTLGNNRWHSSVLWSFLWNFFKNL